MGLRVVDKPAECAGCPLVHKGKGFVSGIVQGKPLWVVENGHAILNPEATTLLDQVNLGFCGEAPALDELLQQKPFSGRAGQLLQHWAFEPAGVDFNDCLVDNVLHCVQPDNELPPVEELRPAIVHCRRYSVWKQWGAQRDMLTYHPAALLRDPVPLPLLVHDIGRAREMSEEGVKTRVLLGSASIGAFHPYATAVSRWRGHVTDAVMDEEKKDEQIHFTGDILQGMGDITWR